MQGVMPAELIRIRPNRWTQPFWDAARDYRLIVPRCRDCETFRLPPSPFCWRCRSQEVEWIDHDGRGEIYSFTVIRHPVIPEAADSLPVIAAVVELPGTGGCRLIGNVINCETDAVSIGAPVELSWYDVNDDTTVPCFELID